METYEAFESMKQGKKIRKRWWKKGDYLRLNSNSNIVKGNIIDNSETKSIIVSLDFLNAIEVGYDGSWEILEEPEEPLLTEEEKEYLKMIIKFTPGKVKYVTLGRYAGDCNYIHLNYATDCGTNPAHCVSKGLFKNLESHRMYKLKDLGLEE